MQEIVFDCGDGEDVGGSGGGIDGGGGADCGGDDGGGDAVDAACHCPRQ